jgi:hypothetical protein
MFIPKASTSLQRLVWLLEDFSPGWFSRDANNSQLSIPVEKINAFDSLQSNIL